MSDLPIGIFDSGVGGLTVYRALHNRLPNERFVYLGDTARVPYGTKSMSTVERYAIENSRFLESRGIKMLVVACDSASAFGLPTIRDAIRRVSDDAEVIQAACPLFVPLAEEGWTSEPETYSIAKRYLQPVIDASPDALVLGCTHYPILKEVIQQTMGENVTLIDSGEA